MYELLIKIHDILDNAVTKQVGNTAHLVASLFLLPGSIVKTGPHISYFFTILRTLFLLVKLVFMTTITIFGSG